MGTKAPARTNGESPQRRRGRPRAFDEAALIREAQSLFWNAGYDATTLGDIVARTGVHKPSLYAAFADKRGLFLKTLDLYVRDTRPLMDRALRAETLGAAVAMLLSEDISVFSAERGRGGCYFISVFDEASRRDPVLSDVAQKVWSRLRRLIAERVAEAPERELPRGWTRSATEHLIMSSHVFLAVRGRANASRDELEDFAATISECFPQH